MLLRKLENIRSGQLAENQMLKAASDVEQEGETQEEKGKYIRRHTHKKNMLVASILDTHLKISIQNTFLGAKSEHILGIFFFFSANLLVIHDGFTQLSKN